MLRSTLLAMASGCGSTVQPAASSTGGAQAVPSPAPTSKAAPAAASEIPKPVNEAVDRVRAAIGSRTMPTFGRHSVRCSSSTSPRRRSTTSSCRSARTWGDCTKQEPVNVCPTKAQIKDFDFCCVILKDVSSAWTRESFLISSKSGTRSGSSFFPARRKRSLIVLRAIGTPMPSARISGFARSCGKGRTASDCPSRRRSSLPRRNDRAILPEAEVRSPARQAPRLTASPPRSAYGTPWMRPTSIAAITGSGLDFSPELPITAARPTRSSSRGSSRPRRAFRGTRGSRTVRTTGVRP